MMKALAATILLLAAASAMGAGSGGGGRVAPTVEPTPEQAAASHYRSGLRYKNRALKQEAKAGEASMPEQRDKLLAKAAKSYARAMEKQLEAVKADPSHHEAANELGYALRRMGRYQQAIEWYDHALDLKPGFLEAIEYRGEAYLAIGNIDGAKAAYMELFRSDRELAGQLLGAMEAWLDRQSAASPDVSTFSDWLSERKQLAALSGDVSFGGW